MLERHLIRTIFLSLTVIAVPLIAAQDAKKQVDDSYVQRTFTIGYGGEYNPDEITAQARQFVWESWRQKRPAHCALTEVTVEGDSTTYHFYIGQGEAGRWHVLVEVESNCCWNDAMEGRERKIEKGKESIYFSVERVEPVNERVIPDTASRQPGTFKLRLGTGEVKEGQKSAYRFL